MSKIRTTFWNGLSLDPSASLLSFSKKLLEPKDYTFEPEGGKLFKAWIVKSVLWFCGSISRMDVTRFVFYETLQCGGQKGCDVDHMLIDKWETIHTDERHWSWTGQASSRLPTSCLIWSLWEDLQPPSVRMYASGLYLETTHAVLINLAFKWSIPFFNHAE